MLEYLRQFPLFCFAPSGQTNLAVRDDVVDKVDVLSEGEGEVLSSLPQRDYPRAQTGVELSDIRHTHSCIHLHLQQKPSLVN